MNIKVKAFASISDICGFRELSLSFQDSSTAGDVLKHLKGNHAGLKKLGSGILLAVNGEYCGPKLKLKEGDVIAVFPPVSGG
jgi:molybdopterin synthase sulfur carrier subunit